MAYFDAVIFRATTGGTGDFVVSAAITGYRTPAAASVPNASTGSYRAESDDLTEWEEGTYSYTSGTTTVVRTVTSNSLGTTAKINFTVAPKVGFVASAADLAAAESITTGTIATARLGSGTANSGTFLRGDSTWQAVTVPVEATQAEMEAATNTVAFVSPRSFKWSPFALKAWCKWGTTTTIDASAGVSSITDNGTGDWTVNWSTAFSSANYAADYTIEQVNINPGICQIGNIKTSGQAAGSLRVFCLSNSNDGTGSTPLSDPAKNHVMAAGDQ
jgi:hypothetical protein